MPALEPFGPFNNFPGMKDRFVEIGGLNAQFGPPWRTSADGPVQSHRFSPSMAAMGTMLPATGASFGATTMSIKPLLSST